MSDISAALGISQLKSLSKFLKKRNLIAKKYNNFLKNLPIKTQKILPQNYSSYHLFIIQIDLKKSKISYNKIIKLFREKNFFVNLHYTPVHLSPYFKKIGFKKNDFPISENYQENSLSIPIFNDLKEKNFFKIINLIKSIFIK